MDGLEATVGFIENELVCFCIEVTTVKSPSGFNARGGSQISCLNPVQSDQAGSRSSTLVGMDMNRSQVLRVCVTA